jgi:hypothetical protein
MAGWLIDGLRAGKNIRFWDCAGYVQVVLALALIYRPRDSSLLQDRCCVDQLVRSHVTTFGRSCSSELTSYVPSSLDDQSQDIASTIAYRSPGTRIGCSFKNKSDIYRYFIFLVLKLIVQQPRR